MYVFLQVNPMYMKSVTWCDEVSRARTEFTKNPVFSISENKAVISSNLNWCPNEIFKINECIAVGVERLTGLDLTLCVYVCVFLCVSLSLLLLTKGLHAASFFTPAIDCVKWDTLFREIFISSAQTKHILRHTH